MFSLKTIHIPKISNFTFKPNFNPKNRSNSSKNSKTSQNQNSTVTKTPTTKHFTAPNVPDRMPIGLLKKLDETPIENQKTALQGGFPKMSYFRVKKVSSGHFRVTKRDLRSFLGRNMLVEVFLCLKS